MDDMTQRTDAEIFARLKEIEPIDWIGTERGDLLSRLAFDDVRQFLNDDMTSEQWAETKRGRDEEAVKAEMLNYMAFAWEKANNCRGLSAGRSLNHMSAWLWLLGHDKAAEQIREYDLYGKPWLRAICEAFGWDWRQWDDGQWRNDESSDGHAPPESVAPLDLSTV